jgi:hypothetical protein
MTELTILLREPLSERKRLQPDKRMAPLRVLSRLLLPKPTVARFAGALVELGVISWFFAVSGAPERLATWDRT